MAIGAHELLLIVRAQNQASALLGRVGRDFRRLQAMKSLDMQRSRVANQMASNALQMQTKMAKIGSVVNANGKARLQHEQAVARNQLQQMNIANRITNLEMRRTSVARAEAGLEVQRLRLLQQEANLERTLEKIEFRRMGIQNQIGRYGVQLQRGMQQGERLKISQLNTQAQILERQVAYNKANRAYQKVSRTGSVAGTDVSKLRSAARLRLAASQATLATFPGQRELLSASMAGVQAEIAKASASLELLRGEEAKVAETATILNARHAQLAEQLANVRARGVAVAGVEAELNQQLKITTNELHVLAAAWDEQLAATAATTAGMEINIEQQRILAATMKDVEAQTLLQKAETATTKMRGLSHVGRVLQATGLIGVAAFGAMAISAAHFNSEAVRASTQVGSIGSNASTVVANAGRIEKAVEGIMQVIPADQHQLTDTLYNIYSSMNTTFGQGTKLLKLFGQVWEAGGMTGTVEDVSNALITLGNNWKISANDMAGWNKLAASTLATVRFARLTVEQYTQTMNQLAPAFHGAHQSIEQMNGAIAFLTTILPGANVSAAGIARMMEQLQRFAANPKPGFEDLAKSIQDVNGNLLPLDQVLSIILKKMPQLKTSGTALNNFFKTVSGTQGTVQARRALQGFVLNFEAYQHTLKQTSGDQQEFNRSLKAMEQSTGVKWALFVNQMRALGLELGTAVVPGLLAAAAPLQKLAHWFNHLSDEQKKSMGHWLGLVAVGLLISGTVATIVGGLALFITSLKTVGKAFGVLEKEAATTAGSVGKLSSEVGAITPRVAMLLAKLTLLGTAFYIIQSQTHDLGKTLHYLSYVVLAAAIVKLVQLGAKLRMARNAMIGLRLATMGEIVALIYLAYVIAKAIDSIPGLDSAIRRLFSAVPENIDATGKSLDKLRESLQSAPEWARKMVIVHLDASQMKRELKDISRAVDKFEHPGTSRLPRTGFIRAMKLPPGVMQTRLEQMFPELTPKQIKRLVAKAESTYKTETQRVLKEQRARMESFTPYPKSADIAIQAAGPGFLQAIRNAYKLKKAMDEATNLKGAFKALTAYNTYFALITKNMSKEQKAMLQELLGMMGQFATAVQQIPTEKMIAAAQNVQTLQAAYQKSGSREDYKKYIAALNALNKAGTTEQISAANDLAQARIGNEVEVAKVSDRTAIQMARHLAKLEMIAGKAPTVKNWKAVADYQKIYDNTVISSQQTLADNILQSEKELADKKLQITKDSVDKRKQLEQSGVQSLTAIYQEAMQQYQGYLGTLFQGPFVQSAVVQNRQHFGFALRPQDLVRDMKMSVQHAEKFQGSLNRLRTRISGAGGASVASALTQQIAALGPDAQKELNVVGQMSGKQFREWVNWFKRGQQDAKIQAAKELKSRLKEWMKFGKSVALAIATGIQSEDVALQKAMIAMFEKMFPGFKGAAPTPNTKPSLPRRVQGRGNVNNHVINETTNYHINPGHQGEGWETALRRAHFRQKNRKK